MFVKLCGIRDMHDLDIALASNPDAVGFICGVTHRTEDAVSPTAMARMVRALPQHITPVLVTHYIFAEAVHQLIIATGARAVQLSGSMPVSEVQRLRALQPHISYIRAFHVEPNVTPVQLLTAIAAFDPLLDAALLDSRTPDRLGGTGQPHDWNISRAVIAQSPIPVILAGGLRPENVAMAIDTAQQAAGVDVNTGVEDAHRAKDRQRCAEFVATARRYHHPFSLTAAHRV